LQLAGAHIARDLEGDSALGSIDDDGVSDGRQIAANFLEMGRRDLQEGIVFLVGNAEDFAIDVHELEIEFSDTIIVGRFENESHSVGIVLGSDGHFVFVSGTFEDLGEGREINSERKVAVATILKEAVFSEEHCDEADMAGVHGLDGNSSRGAIEIGFIYEVFDSVKNLFEKGGVFDLGFKHDVVERRGLVCGRRSKSFVFRCFLGEKASF